MKEQQAATAHGHNRETCGGSRTPGDAGAADIAFLLDSAKAPATRKAYRSDWTAFHAWCRAHSRSPLPADVDTVLLWLCDQADAGYAAGTIQRRLVTIRHAHRSCHYPSPTEHQAVRDAWVGVRRRLGVAARRVAPITIELLRRIVATCDRNASGRRDHALLIVGFAGALRRSELAALTVDDTEPHPDGLVITIRQSKTDQTAQGQRIGIPRGSNPDTCPIRTLQAWRHQARLHHGPLFRPVDRHGNIAARQLSGRAVAEIIKRRARAAGLDPRHYSGHSLRAGFATSAAAAGATEIAIARQTRHRSMTVLRGYIREANLFRTNAATTVGL